METDNKTEREKFIDNLEKKVRKSVLANKFNDSAEGKMMREWAAEQVNTVIKQLAGKKFIDDHNGYIYATGELSAFQKMVAMLDAEANTDTAHLVEQIKEAKSDGQPKQPAI